MQSHQRDFIALALEYEALRFGEFTLKSGRVSPYFFNAGLFNTAAALSRLGSCYAAALQASGVACDMLFGPAYKGIPLVSATAIALVRDHQRDLPFAFNRKEAKAHGEGGRLIGAPLDGRVVIVDDVITAGTAVRESLALIEDSPAQLAAILVGLDRFERGRGELSATQELARELHVPVLSIVTIDQVVDFVAQAPELAPHLPAMRAYRDQWRPASG